MPASAGSDVRPMSPCSRSVGVSAISTAIVVDSPPWASTASGPEGPSSPPQPGRTTSPASSRNRNRLDECPSLEAEEELLALEASRVADEAPRRTDDAMAGDDDRHGVSVECSADRPGRLRLSDARGEPAVGVHLSVGHAPKLREHALLEHGEGAQVDAEVELVSPPLEVLVELAASLVHGTGR